MIDGHGSFGAPPRGGTGRPRSTAARPATVALALVAALWLLALSAAQVTSRAVAIPALERTLAALADVDALLLLHEQEIRAGAAGAAPGARVAVPGFPVAAAALTAEAARASTRAQWRAALLGAAAAAVYDDGLGAFEQGGRAATAGLLYTPGSVRLVLENLSASRHRLASGAAWALGLAALALVTAVLAIGVGARRFVAIGLALLIGALLAALAGLTAMLLVVVVGHDQSQLASEVAGIARTLAWAPVSAALRAGFAGLAIAVPAAAVAAWQTDVAVDGAQPPG